MIYAQAFHAEAASCPLPASVPAATSPPSPPRYYHIAAICQTFYACLERQVRKLMLCLTK